MSTNKSVLYLSWGAKSPLQESGCPKRAYTSGAAFKMERGDEKYMLTPALAAEAKKEKEMGRSRSPFP